VRTTSRSEFKTAALAKHDSLYCRIVGQHGQHTSPWHASQTDRDSRAILAQRSARSRVRLNTVTRCPARSKLFAIPAPILAAGQDSGRAVRAVVGSHGAEVACDWRTAVQGERRQADWEFSDCDVLESLGEALAFARKSGVDAAALLDF